MTDATIVTASQGEPRIAADAAGARERLDGDVGDAEHDPGRGAEEDAVVLMGRTLGDQTMKPPTASRPASKLIMAACE